jgi:serine/threonine protein kinase
MAAQQGRVPTTADLQAFCLGKLDPPRAGEVEAYLAEHPECWPVLETAPDDDVIRPLRGAGNLPRRPPRSPLLQLAVDAVIPVLGGCAGALGGGPEGGVVGVVVGQVAEKAINFFGQRIVNKWLEWLRKQPPGMQVAALTQLAEVLPEVARSEVRAALEQKAPQVSPADRQVAIDYLSAIPRSVRRSLLTDRERGGRTLPPRISMDDSLSLLQLLPADLPPYSAPTALPGTDYRLEELIGSGGFGAVYRASGPSLQHLPLAIKFCLDRSLLPVLQQERANLERLMKAGGEAWSPRLVRLYGYNLEHRTPFLVYEYVSGGDLVHWLAARQVRDGHGLTAAEVLELIIQVAEALAFAHQRGLVHRDLKPANVLMGDGTIKLADFGIGGLAARQAVQVSRIGTVAPSRLSPAEQASLFRGAGTPLYMSKEQREGNAPDPRHDLYSLGVMWYQLLVGDVTREMTHGWTEELTEEHSVPPAHIETIKQCVGLLRHRPESAAHLLKILRGLTVRVTTPETDATQVKPSTPQESPALSGDKAETTLKPKPAALAIPSLDLQARRDRLFGAVNKARNWWVHAYAMGSVLALYCCFMGVIFGLVSPPVGHQGAWWMLALVGGGASVVGLLRAIQLYARHKSTLRESLVGEIDAALRDFPDLRVFLGSTAERRDAESGWEIIRWLDKTQPTPKASVQLIHPGSSYMGDQPIRLYVNGLPVGESTTKVGVNLNVKLTPGRHLLEIRWVNYGSVTRSIFECPVPESYEVEIHVTWFSIARVARKA